MLLIGIVGIEDPLREGVRKAVEDFQKAGVAVKICTGDNVLTARSIATTCGIFMAQWWGHHGGTHFPSTRSARLIRLYCSTLLLDV